MDIKHEHVPRSVRPEACAVCCSDAAAQQHPDACEPGDDETPNYEEKAQEIVQSILQEVVSTVAGGETCCNVCWLKEVSNCALKKYIWCFKIIISSHVYV